MQNVDIDIGGEKDIDRNVLWYRYGYTITYACKDTTRVW